MAAHKRITKQHFRGFVMIVKTIKVTEFHFQLFECVVRKTF